MSTEHQQYSTENQRDAIAEFARARGFEIVETYADESGADSAGAVAAPGRAGRAV